MTQTYLTLQHSNYKADKNMNNKDFMRKFLMGKAIIQTLNAHDSIRLSKYCRERGFRSRVDDETITCHFEWDEKNSLFYLIDLSEYTVRLGSKNWKYIDNPMAIYDPDMLNLPTFRL